MLRKNGRKLSPETALLLTILASVFIVELGLEFFSHDFFTGFMVEFFDAVVLTAILFPVLYKFVIVPLKSRSLEILKVSSRLKESDSILGIVAENAPIGFAFVNRDLEYIYANKQIASIIGVTPDFMIGKRVKEVVGDSVWGAVGQFYEGVLSDNAAIIKKEVYVETKSNPGQKRLLSTSYFPINAGDEFIGVGILAEDITERKKNEELLSISNRALAVLSAVNRFLVSVGDEKTFMDQICKSIVELGGYQMAWVGFAENDEEKKVTPVSYYGNENGYLKTVNVVWSDSERGHGPTGTAIRDARVDICKNMLYEKRFSPWLKEAMKRGYQSSIGIPLVVGGSVIGALTMYSDRPDAFDSEEVSLLSQVGSDVAHGIFTIRTRKKVGSLDQLKNKFISIVSHQMRTPLNSIRWILESLIGDKKSKLTASEREQLRICHDSSVNIIDQIRNLLTALDIEGDRLEKPNLVPISFDSLVRSAVSIIEGKFKLKNIKHSFDDSGKESSMVYVDQEKIRIAVEAILENALIYTPENGRVAISVKKIEDRIRLEVSDTGIGIPEEEKQFIFTKFYRCSNAHLVSTDASGLSLYIAKHFVLQHGGEISFKSTEGKGSVFHLDLPLLNKNQLA